jgi:hypothetical protein
MTSQAHAESVLGRIEWQTTTLGYCLCPGASSHSHNTGKRDCRVTIDGAPTVHCFHSSCQGAIEEANRQLRRKQAGERRVLPFVPRGNKEGAVMFQHQLVHAIASAEPHDYETELWHTSPIELPGDPREDFRLFMDRMWHPDDIVWNGEVEDSGRSEMGVHWRRAADCDVPLGRFTSGSTYQPDTVSRAAVNVHTARYLVLESDTLPPWGMIALAKELTAPWPLCYGLSMRAMVWTGGKSIHVWFDRPPQARIVSLKTVAPFIGLDPKTFHTTQPVRMPGVERDDGIWQKLLWMNSRPQN